MPLYSTILCAIDFSEHSRRALQLALRLGARGGSRVVAVHVIEAVLAEAAAALPNGPNLREDVQAELEAFVGAELAADTRRPASVVRIGRPEQEILACAADSGADLIVMGTQGLGGIQKWFFGSIAEKVLRDSRLPVLAVPLRQDAGTLEVRRVIAAVELSASSDPVVDTAVAVARELSLAVTLLHVVPRVHAAPTAAEAVDAALQLQASGARGHLADLATRVGHEVPVDIDVRVGSPAEQIAAAATEPPRAVVVIGAGSAGAHRRPGSVAYRVLSQSDAPVLAVPE